MKKRHYLVAAMCLMTLASCTQKTELPENPKDKEEYRDSQGNSWIYAFGDERAFYDSLLLSEYRLMDGCQWYAGKCTFGSEGQPVRNK